MGEFESVLTEIKDFISWETKTALDPGRRLQCELARIDSLSPCGRVDPKTENAVGHERFTARESFAHCCGRTGLDGDEHLDGRRHRTRVFKRSSWSDPVESLTQMDFIVTSRKSEMRRAQVLDSDWFKTDHRAVLAVHSLKTKMRFSVKRCELAWLEARRLLTKSCGNGEVKEMSVTGIELKSLLLRKRRNGRQLGKIKLNWLCRAIWRRRGALQREKHLNKIKESAETGKAPKKTQNKHFNWSSIAKQENPETELTNFFQDLYSILVDRRDLTQSARFHWIELWKNLRMHSVDFAKETGESP